MFVYLTGQAVYQLSSLLCLSICLAKLYISCQACYVCVFDWPSCTSVVKSAMFVYLPGQAVHQLSSQLCLSICLAKLYISCQACYVCLPMCLAKLYISCQVCYVCLSAWPSCTSVVKSAVFASLSAHPFPLTLAWPRQQIHSGPCQGKLYIAMCWSTQPIHSTNNLQQSDELLTVRTAVHGYVLVKTAHPL